MKLHEIAELQSKTKKRIYFKYSPSNEYWTYFHGCKTVHDISENNQPLYNIGIDDLIHDEWVIRDEKPEIKPCPFCGGDPSIRRAYVGMQCNNCRYDFFGFLAEKHEQMIERWNRRV